ncbi:MAG: DegT/DnrJ/EryC1/StrS family aminotransferase [Deltaproteobacteria bacterium]|nr:DegT/DnrJ/EryC1/StrS family aminotransferase [Deltaproteobacteria bacterium]
MKIQRTMPPAANPVSPFDLIRGLRGIFFKAGPLKRAEEEIKNGFGTRHVFFVSSGKAALALILMAMKRLRPGKRRVIIPAYTCFSVPSAIIKAKLEVVPCDIDPETLDLDYSRLLDVVNDDTLCVIPTHLFGAPSDVVAIKKICAGKDVFTIEDAAQAMGTLINGSYAGTMGEAGFFSFGRGKNISCGSGGAIITNSDELAAELAALYAALPSPCVKETIKDYLTVLATGILLNPWLYWLPSGIKSLELGKTIFYKDFPVKKLSGMKAGLLMNLTARLMLQNAVRRQNADFFIKEMRLDNRQGVAYLRLPVMAESMAERDALYHASSGLGLGLSLMYPTPIAGIEELAGYFAGTYFPGAEAVSQRLIAVPTHSLLTLKDTLGIIALFGTKGLSSSQ